MTTEHSGEEKAARLRVGVIAGSTRPGRQSRTVAEWVCADPDPVPGPAADRPRRFRPAVALRASTSRVRPVPAAFHAIVSQLIETFDAFVLVTPEYNHSTSAALKNALDHLYREWRDKPVAFVGYGLDGGTRPSSTFVPSLPSWEWPRSARRWRSACVPTTPAAASNRGPFNPRHASGCSTSSLAGQRRCGHFGCAPHRPRDKSVPRSTIPQQGQRQPARSNSSSPDSKTASTAPVPMPTTSSSHLTSCGAIHSEAPCLDTRRSTPHTTRSWPQASPLHPGTRSCSS
jgi:hypothetical protein